MCRRRSWKSLKCYPHPRFPSFRTSLYAVEASKLVYTNLPSPNAVVLPSIRPEQPLSGIERSENQTAMRGTFPYCVRIIEWTLWQLLFVLHLLTQWKISECFGVQHTLAAWSSQVFNLERKYLSAIRIVNRGSERC